MTNILLMLNPRTDISPTSQILKQIQLLKIDKTDFV